MSFSIHVVVSGKVISHDSQYCWCTDAYRELCPYKAKTIEVTMTIPIWSAKDGYTKAEINSATAMNSAKDEVENKDALRFTRCFIDLVL